MIGDGMDNNELHLTEGILIFNELFFVTTTSIKNQTPLSTTLINDLYKSLSIN